MDRLKRSRAAKLIEGFSGKRLLVLGDIMLDEFIWGTVSRISPEAPVPVVEIQRESQCLGGAGNVVNNLRALGAQVIPVGVIGNDAAGEKVKAKLEENGTKTAGLIVDSTRPTTIKTRIIAHNQLVVRADRERRSSITPDLEEKLLSSFKRLIEDVSAVIISDYDKGVLTPRVLTEAITLANQRALPICIDPKIRHFAYYRNATVITPNHLEAAAVCRIEIASIEDLVAAAKQISEQLQCQNILITRGEQGMSLFSSDSQITHIPTVAREVYDVTGAGDTVIATLALALTSGASVIEAAILANYAAGIVVGKVGTATTSREELLSSIP